MVALAVLFGLFVGVVLGTIGGGGAALALPLLVHGLGLSPHEAVGISLAAVGATAMVGTLMRLGTGAIDVHAGLLFAAAGILGAPAGAWLHHQLPERVVMLLFALLMLAIAAQMWRRSQRSALQDDGRLRPGKSSVIVILGVGLVVGVLSGLLGVGGGILIVPAFLVATNLTFHQAAATALLVIAMISAAGVVSHHLNGHTPDPPLTLAFICGGLVGMFVGLRLAKRVSGVVLQRAFALLLVAVAFWELLSSGH